MRGVGVCQDYNKDQTFSLQAEKRKLGQIKLALNVNPHLNSPLIFDRLDSINQCPFHTILLGYTLER